MSPIASPIAEASPTAAFTGAESTSAWFIVAGSMAASWTAAATALAMPRTNVAKACFAFSPVATDKSPLGAFIIRDAER